MARPIKIHGVEYPSIQDASNALGFRHQMLSGYRITHPDLSDGQRVELYLRRRDQGGGYKTSVTYDGVGYSSVRKACLSIGVPESTVRELMQRMPCDAAEAIRLVLQRDREGIPLPESRNKEAPKKPPMVAMPRPMPMPKPEVKRRPPSMLPPSDAFEAEERAAIERALAAGRVQRIEQGEWPSEEQTSVARREGTLRGARAAAMACAAHRSKL